MKERPILFSGEMVRAILDGRKTQTRRVVKPQPVYAGAFIDDGILSYLTTNEDDEPDRFIKCPYGKPGDRLWVRETWGCSYVDAAHGRAHVVGGTWGSPARPDRVACVVFLSDGPIPNESPFETAHPAPSIHMPRWASRIILEITGIRCERVQDISANDICAEGVDCVYESDGALSDHYNRQMWVRLWDSINAKRGYGWDVNPWVWVVEFKKATSA